MITVILDNDEFRQIGGNPTMTSLDGELRAPLRVILASSWTAEDRAAFGVYQVDVTPLEGYVWTGQISNNDGIPEPIFEPVPPPSTQEVIEERRRRLALGFDYDFEDTRGIHRIATTEQDHKGWDKVSKLATSAILAGASDTEITIHTETGGVAVTAAEWQQIVIAVGMWEQPIWQVSFALQQMNPIPADFADDKWWSMS
ncbi:MAG: hypothetical protein WC997_02450 [Porticoccaceae bacterium]